MKNRCLAVFTDVYEENNEMSQELSQSVSSISAISLKKEILSINFERLLKRKEVIFVVIGEDKRENLDHSLSLISRYGKHENAKLYTFTSSEEAELFISCAYSKDVKMQVRTEDIRQLYTYNYIFNNDIYKNYIIQPNGRKLYSIAFIGFGEYSKELLKAMLWAYQYPAFDLEINIFSKDINAKSVFEAKCPEIIKFNNCNIDGESRYKLTFCTVDDTKAYNFNTKEFEDKLVSIKNITNVFVEIGDDGENIETSINLRRLFEKNFENKPEINALTSNMTKTDSIMKYDMVDFRNQAFNINFFASINDVYTYDVLFNSELEKLAIERHLAWYKKDNASSEVIEEKSREFFKYKYYYKSSMASVIRAQGQKRTGVSGADKSPENRTETEKYEIMKAEHMGWNTYMRCEGYTYGKERNDMAKTHYDLVAFEDLPYEEKIKDEV